MGNIRMKELRQQLKLTQAEAANLAKMKQQEWQKLETGKNDMRVSKLLHICRTFNVDPNWLLGVDGTLAPGAHGDQG